ncbi:leucine-rich repeat domain-containing protein [Cryomorphaceae bacterium 1068]|nr:leucine-rich repeat domain-containing protein [Cryomorphaceae bacterium 1068]
MKTTLLFCSMILAGAIMGQKIKTNTAKSDFLQYPSVPVEGMKSLGIEVYTADLPINKDTLRLYLGNMDLMKSDMEQVSKIDFKALNEVSIVGGEGDITIDLALGKPSVLSKEQKTSSCMVAKDGCTQYYFVVKYNLPAVVRAKNATGVVDTWELNSDMELQFGNEQIEKHVSTDEGSVTSIQVVNYTSEADLALAFNEIGSASMTRKAVVKQLGNLAESIYHHVFFEETKLKMDIAYGVGNAADYTETETAADNAVAAIESKNYSSLTGPVKIWESWLERYDAENKKAAVNNKVAQGLYENLSIGYTFIGEFDKARTNLDEALKLAQTGSVNTNEVNRLEEFHEFIDQQENVKKYNSSLVLSKLVTAPDIKKLLGNRKANKDINFLIAEDKYAEIAKIHGAGAPKKDISEMTVEEFMSQAPAEGSSGDEEISLDGRVENNMLILSGLVDGNMRGKALPRSICEYPDIKTIRARNIGLTALPDCMDQLTKLEKLYINSNTFTELPDAFGAMKNLEVLDISDNNLKNIPPSLFTLTGLKKIYISGNQFSDEDVKKLEAALFETSFK